MTLDHRQPRPPPGANGSGTPAPGPAPAPPAAANRGYLRTGLPAAYLEADFTMRFVGSLEEQLDPIVATLDSLARLISPETAPLHVLRLEAHWLGLEVDEDLPVSVCRNLVRNAPELNRRRGTVAGLQLLLGLTFPGVPLTVEDRGRVTFGGSPPALAPTHAFAVRCARPLDPDLRDAVTHVIDRERPAHVSYELIEPSRTWAATR